jgi:hypothetical protein
MPAEMQQRTRIDDHLAAHEFDALSINYSPLMNVFAAIFVALYLLNRADRSSS